MQPVQVLYPLHNYSFGVKDKKKEKEASLDQKMQRLRSQFEKEGMRRTVEGILLVQEHNHPHVLLLQLGQSFFKLPGGRLRAGEEEIEGLKRKLTGNLSPTNPALQSPWDVSECAGMYWRPNFDTLFFPYLPTHATKPKECKKLFVVPLADKGMFAVPANSRLVAVPLYELYDNVARYGPILSSIPFLLSRYRLNMVAAQPAPAPSLQPPPAVHDKREQQQAQQQLQAVAG